jgi:hypothetical protein
MSSASFLLSRSWLLSASLATQFESCLNGTPGQERDSRNETESSVRHPAVGANVPESAQVSMRVQRGWTPFSEPLRPAWDARGYTVK